MPPEQKGEERMGVNGQCALRVYWMNVPAVLCKLSGGGICQNARMHRTRAYSSHDLMLHESGRFSSLK